MKQLDKHPTPSAGCTNVDLQLKLDPVNKAFVITTSRFIELLTSKGVPSESILKKHSTGRSELTIAESIEIIKDKIFDDVRADIYLEIINAFCAFDAEFDVIAKTTSEYISIKDFARRTQLCRASVEKYIHTGKLEAIRLGRSYRIHKDVLKTWRGGRNIQKNI